MIDSLLTLCARLSWEDSIPTQFEKAVTHCCDWSRLLEAAEAHGLSSLLYHHLCRTGLPELPESARITLKLQYLRHRRRSQVWTAVLRDVLLAYQESKIDLFLLKGGALRHILYPDPALRPVGDLDLLVKSQDAPQAQQATHHGVSLPRLLILEIKSASM